MFRPAFQVFANCIRNSSNSTRQISILSFSRLNQAEKVNSQHADNKTKSPEEEAIYEPIKFFGSKAATWSAQKSRSGGVDDAVWYQPLVISFSLTVFLIYFCYLREENDIDIKLEKTLYDHVDGLEATQLQLALKYNIENGIDTKAIEKRMAELGIPVNFR